MFCALAIASQGGSHSRTEHGESGTKKRAIGITPYRHYGIEEKELILASIERVKEMVGAPVQVILGHLGLPPTTYYRWRHRRAIGSLADRIASPKRRIWPPIPQEIDSVRSYALEYPQIGYKRLTWQMIDDDVAYLNVGPPTAGERRHIRSMRFSREMVSYVGVRMVLQQH